jgi:hypothetical protein
MTRGFIGGVQGPRGMPHVSMQFVVFGVDVKQTHAFKSE